MMRLGVVVLASACLAAATLSVRAQDANRDPMVVVELKPSVQVSGSLVRIRDVADLQGGSAASVGRIGALDLIVVDGLPEHFVSRDQVYFRIRLAGWTAQQFRLTGAAATVVGRAPSAIQPTSVAIAASAPAASAGSSVKPRDPVRLMARIGNVQVSARGEALQEGQVGQMIRVRNLSSNRIISGRLSENNIVEVDH